MLRDHLTLDEIVDLHEHGWSPHIAPGCSRPGVVRMQCIYCEEEFEQYPEGLPICDYDGCFKMFEREYDRFFDEHGERRPEWQRS